MHRDREIEHRCACTRTPSDPALGPRPFRLPGDQEHFGIPRPFDLHHISLSITLDVERARIEATAAITFSRRAPDAHTLSLDAVAFEVRSVSRLADGKLSALSWHYDGERLHVRVGVLADGRRDTIVIDYAAAPRRGLYFLRPDDDVPTRPWQVWSQCQDEDARYWLPCVDAPLARHTIELRARVPGGWRALSNGSLIEHRSEAGVELWHWRQDEPVAPYLITLVAGTFAEVDASAEAGLPCRYYVDPGHEDEARRTFGHTPAMIRHFASVTGVAYPWVKYDQVAVHDFTFGGMENTSATTMTARMLLNERAAIDVSMDDLVAHELAHQWFGDLVTCRDWSHAWLNEGFATFFEHVDIERREGRDAYLYNLKEHTESYLREDEGEYRRPIVCATWAAPIDLFDGHLYEKGGLVLHMLRAELGDATFWRAVRLYLERHRGGVVETRDLVRAMEDVSGRSLEGFFDQWVMRAGHPEVEVEARHEPEEGSLVVTVRQTQSVDAVTALFRFKLRVAVVDESGERTHDLEVRDATHTFYVRCEAPPRRVAVDPDGAVLMKLTQKLPRDWLLDALDHDPRAIVRWRAAAALPRKDDARVVERLNLALGDDRFWGVAAECARALSTIRSDDAFFALASRVSVKHPKTRRAVIAALGTYRTEMAATLLGERLAAGDASCMVEAELARSLGATRRASVYEALVAALDRRSWRDVVRVGAIDGLRALRDLRAIDVVTRYTARSHGVTVRRAAAAALGELGEGKVVVREHLEAMLDEDDPVVTPAVIHALVQLRDPAASGPLSRVLAVSSDGRVRRTAREALRALRDERRGDEVRKVRDELDAVREDLSALRVELSKLRATTRPAPSKRTATKPRKPTARKAPARKAPRRR